VKHEILVNLAEYVLCGATKHILENSMDKSSAICAVQHKNLCRHLATFQRPSSKLALPVSGLVFTGGSEFFSCF